MVIVSKIENVNSSSKILKYSNEIKNHLLTIRGLHGAQGTSIISFERIGRTESVQRFKDVDVRINLVFDSTKAKIDSVNRIDSSIVVENRFDPPNIALATLKSNIENLKLFNGIYSNMFDSIVANHSNAQNSLKIPIWRNVIDDGDRKFSSLLDESVNLIDEQTNIRIKEIEDRVANVKEMTLYIISGVTIFALIFGLFFSRAITNALRRLKESASTIGRGDFNFDPSGYSNDEIGDLANAFFQMSVDLKNVQEELIQSKRLAAIGEVVASVNHEINNPLMIISGNAQFLEMMMERYPDELRERVRTILEETERISRVTKKLREIKNPVVEDYTSSGEQMINLDKSSK
ncbi:MAG TPA: histidine kinase dimerization/phospho-acceptor domain-containing protein [Chitinispirillaceae bacterium]|jgi:signal transduction histidine kinase|nr:histidine kinase dimerization/phospho-acceptor domain-containing protein [Chitinispirillaceae bacterium]